MANRKGEVNSNASLNRAIEDAEVKPLLPSTHTSCHVTISKGVADEIIDHDDEEDQEETLSGVPIDRGWAWVVVGATFFMHILSVGVIVSFGVLIVEFMDKYNVSGQELGIVHGITMTLMFALGLGANLLAVQFTSQKVVFAGGLLTALGLITSASIPRFEFLYLTYCVIAGLGFALSYTPCLLMVGLHFKKRRSLANGIALSGSGVGTFIVPNIMRWMLNEYGLRGCLLLLGGLMLNVCVCAMLLRPISSYVSDKTQEEECQKGVIDKDTDLQQLMEITKKEIVSETCDSNSEIKDNSENGHHTIAELYQETTVDSHKTALSEFVNNGDIFMRSMQSIPQEEMQSISARLCVRIKCLHCRKKTRSPGGRRGPKLFNWSLLSNPLFLIYASCACAASFSNTNIYFMVPAFAESNGHDRDSSALLASILGISDLVGRPFLGWLSDLQFLPRRFIFAGCVSGGAVLCLMAPLMTSFAAMAVLTTLYGFVSGSYFVLVYVMLAETLGVDKLSSSYGLVTLAMAVGVLPGPLICGWIQDATSRWDFGFLMSGVVALLGSTLPLFEPCAKRHIEKRKARKHKNRQLTVGV